MHIFVSGVFDMLHSGHVEFLAKAAEQGYLHVSVASDRTAEKLKGRRPTYTEDERLFMVQSIGVVYHAFIAKGEGMLDFQEELGTHLPDRFVVNEDGDTVEKQSLCRGLGIDYRVYKRTPRAGLPARSATDLRMLGDRMPYRIDLAGAWLDQPWVSEPCRTERIEAGYGRAQGGWVITASLEPTHDFLLRSGMATSTRTTARRLWRQVLPSDDPEETAWTLFCADNPPGEEPISGAQDAIGIAHPGICRHLYAGEYWPLKIERNDDTAVARFLEDHIRLVHCGEGRPPDFNPLGGRKISRGAAMDLDCASRATWDALLNRNALDFGRTVYWSYRAQREMFPAMETEAILATVQQYPEKQYGFKVTGAGGGGYVMFVTDETAKAGLRVRVRRAAPLDDDEYERLSEHDPVLPEDPR